MKSPFLIYAVNLQVPLSKGKELKRECILING